MKMKNLCLVCALLLTACGKQIEMEFVKEVTFEYGEKVDAKKLIKKTNANKKEIKYPKVDTMKVGKQTLKYRVNDKTFALKVNIIDSKYPEIVMSKDYIEITQGDAFVLEDYIVSISDPIDKDLSYSDTKKKGAYTIENNVDVNTPGDYVVKIVAWDKNDNSTSFDFKVTVKEKQIQEVTPQTNPTVNTVPPVVVNDASKRMQIYEQVNAERAKAGVSPLTLDNGALQNIANLRAKELAVKYAHERPDGTYCSDAIKQAGISCMLVGENIANQYGDGYAVMQTWMNSPLHRSNILEANFTSIAIGVYGNYYVQLFIG